MANNVFAFNKLTGGTAGCLDDIDHNNISDGDIAIGGEITADADKFYVYRFKDPSSSGESSPTIIVPDSGGTGEWKLLTTQSASWSAIRTILSSSSLTTVLNAWSIEYDYIWVPAAAMEPRDTNGAEKGTSEDWDDDTNDIMNRYLAFDGTTEEYADFNIVMPATWDRSTIKFKAYWTGASGCSAGDTCEWQLQAVALDDDDDLDTGYSDTGEVISDTVLAGEDGDLHITGASPAVTVNGSPGVGEMIHFTVSRNVSGTDDMTEDAYLFGILIEIKLTNTVSAWS